MLQNFSVRMALAWIAYSGNQFKASLLLSTGVTLNDVVFMYESGSAEETAALQWFRAIQKLLIADIRIDL